MTSQVKRQPTYTDFAGTNCLQRRDLDFCVQGSRIRVCCLGKLHSPADGATMRQSTPFVASKGTVKGAKEMADVSPVSA